MLSQNHLEQNIAFISNKDSHDLYKVNRPVKFEHKVTTLNSMYFLLFEESKSKQYIKEFFVSNFPTLAILFYENTFFEL